MSFSRLATVEMQLVMHCLDRHSLLRLARCNRTTLVAASHDFAFRHLCPLPMALHCTPDLGNALRQSLLRYCTIELVWTSEQDIGSLHPSDKEIARITDIDRLRRIDARPRFNIMSDDWNKLLSSPSLKYVTSISTNGVGLSQSSCISHLNHLDTIHLAYTRHSILLTSMYTCTNLTRLSVQYAGWSVRDFDLVLHALNAPHLRHLALTSDENALWPRMFKHTTMTNLRVLTLRYCGFDSIDACDARTLSGYFVAMRELRMLTVQVYYNIDNLLQCMHHAPKLRHVRVELVANVTAQLSDAAVLTLLAAAPAISFTLGLKQNSGTPREQIACDREYTHWTHIADVHAPRMKVVVLPHRNAIFGPDEP
jgi:hypothetical protein